MVGPKMQDFCPNQHAQRIFFKAILDFFQKKPFKNINLGDHLHTYAHYVLEYILVDILETYMLK